MFFWFTFFMVLCKIVSVSGPGFASSAPLRANWYTRSRKRVTPATCTMCGEFGSGGARAKANESIVEGRVGVYSCHALP